MKEDEIGLNWNATVVISTWRFVAIWTDFDRAGLFMMKEDEIGLSWDATLVTSEIG